MALRLLADHRVSLVPAIEKDWSTEYSDLILSVKIVDTLEQGLEHIHKYGSKHTECIVTEDQAVAECFFAGS